jgi:CubicO group peptidase (beta-lactamase class C family)
MRQIVYAHIVAACGLLSSCGDSAPGESDAQRSGSEQRDFSEVDAVIEDFLSEHALPGATIVVVARDKGELHQRGYGEFEKDRLHLIASGSKIISAGVLLSLSDQGLLDLDAPVSGILTEFGEHKADITTAQCLSGSSGMLGFTGGTSYGPYLCQYIHRGTLQNCTKSLYVAEDTDDLVPPDTQFRYGGAQWQLAGGIAEVVSGKSWSTLIRDLYEPCDVPSLGYDNQYERAQLEGHERSYPDFFLNKGPTETRNPNIEGGGYITTGDYGKLLLMHLRGGMCGEKRVLSEAAVARMQEDRIAEVYDGSTGVKGMQGYGLGWWVDRDHPGVVMLPGLYGGRAWLDNGRGYAAFVALEADETLGNALRDEVKPLLDALF